MSNQQRMKRASGGQSQHPTFGARHIFALREYWSWCCAVCETSDHPIQCVPWLDVDSPDSHGDDPTNMLPLCSVCFTQKGRADPVVWLNYKLGPKEADRKMAQVQTCFRMMADSRAVDFWYEMGLRRALQRSLKSTHPSGTLLIEFVPGIDDDLVLWLNSLDSQQRQDTIKAVLRAHIHSEEFDPLRYLEGILTTSAHEHCELPGKTKH